MKRPALKAMKCSQFVGVTVGLLCLSASGTALAHKASTTLSTALYNNNILTNPENGGYEIRANFTATTPSEDRAVGGISGVILKIQRLENGTGAPQSCSEAGKPGIGWATFAEGVSNASGNFSAFLDTTGPAEPLSDRNRQCFRVANVPAEARAAHGYGSSGGPTSPQELIINLENCGDAPETAGNSCRHIKDACGPVPDGVYWIDPDGAGASFQAYCDMTRHGGGWMLVAELGESAAPMSDFTSDLNEASLLNGIPPAPTEYAHLDLARFDAFGSDWTVRTETDVYNNQFHSQFVFYRPDLALSCLPSLAGSNWKGTATNALLLHLTMSSTTGQDNNTWLSVPECGGGHCDESTMLLWTYRLDSLGNECLDEFGQTQICHSVQGAIADWGGGPGNGTMSAAFGMRDGVSHYWAMKGSYWIKDINTAETP